MGALSALTDPDFLLSWAILAVSLFNTIVQVWLGLTVLLNSERRSWAVWLAGGGLLMGAAFFFSHSAIMGRGITYDGWWMNFFWHAVWFPAVGAPLAWYAVMLWYAGFWDDRGSPLHRRQRIPFTLTLLAGLGLGALLFFEGRSLPDFSQFAQGDLSATYAFRGVSLPVLAYPVYIVACIGLSLDALRSPSPSQRVMGEIARRRARPWLVGTSVVLLLVSLLVAWAMAWVVLDARHPAEGTTLDDIVRRVGLFDVVIGSLIGLATVMLGQAIVSYEIFTGKTLPRRGLVRHWRSALVLAAGYSVVIGWSPALPLHPIHGVLISTLLLAVFFALFSWRSYGERERYIDNLRPFVAGRHLYTDILSRPEPDPHDVDAETPFHALCKDVLGTRLAYLAALGPLSPLVGPPLVYPSAPEPPALPLAGLGTLLGAPDSMCVPVDPERYAGAMWAVPLWSERGLIGVLLLGDKVDGGLYTQEEIEIARASGERLIDTQASAAMAQRLMSLQRTRLAESQVLDRRARRVLHDDVLPLLHTTLLKLSSGAGRDGDVVGLLADAHRQISDLLRELPVATTPDVARLGPLGALRRTVEEEMPEAFDEVRWQVEPEAAAHAREVPSLAAEVLFYAAREAVRNASRHGRNGTGSPLHLNISAAWRDGLEVLIEDDGVGFSPTSASNGSGGHGLALHSTMMAVVGGSLSMESVQGEYTRVVLTLPGS